MRREQRLAKAKDFASVYRKGRAFADRLLVLRLIENGLTRNRYGFVTGRGIGKAVVRNKVRRRLREAVRAQGLAGGWDMVIIARRPAAEADYQRLLRSLRRLLEKAGMPVLSDVEKGDQKG
jgi:ribonuclease P protein component